MKDLINNLIAIYTALIGDSSFSAKSVWKGFSTMPDQMAVDLYPYLAIDDGGERVEDAAQATSNRFYTVVMEMGVIVYDPKVSLDNILDLSNETKTILELETTRISIGDENIDGHIWGIRIDPFELQDEKTKKSLFRGRTVNVDFQQLEFRDHRPF